jgi:ABC-type glycerol-3-phosphate transport system permease component
LALQLGVGLTQRDAARDGCLFPRGIRLRQVPISRSDSAVLVGDRGYVDPALHDGHTMAKLGLINTYPVLVLPFAANAFGLFMMRQYFSTLPDELLQSARIDGCSEFRLFRSIMLPLARPALGTVGILIFIASWNSFIWPLVMMRSEDMFTLPVGIAGLNSEQSPEYGKIMAAAVLSSVPIVTVFFLMQRQIIAGLTQGAVKA